MLLHYKIVTGLLLLLLAGCETPRPLPPVSPPQLPPPPAAVMTPRQPSFLSRIESFLSGSATRQTGLLTSSAPAKPSSEK